MWFFYHYNSERNYDVLKSNSPSVLLKKNVNSNKNETESKLEFPHTVLERRTFCLSLCNYHKLKIKLWWVEARNKKKEGIFCTVYFVRRNFFNICVLSQCIEYWIHFQKIHLFTCQKTLLNTLLCLFLKSPKAYSVSLT